MLRLAGFVFALLVGQSMGAAVSRENPSSGGQEASCPNGWDEFMGGYCYKAFPEEATYAEAKKLCETKSAKLVTILDEDEHDFVQKLLDSNHIGSVWVGIELERDAKSKKVLDAHWADGSKVKFYADPVNVTDERPWGKKEALLKAEGNCARTNTKNSWAVLSCGDKQKYMCKKKMCDSGWSEFAGSCYKVFSDKVDYLEANKRCLSEAGELVSIGDEAENNFVWKLVESAHAGPSVLLGLWVDHQNGTNKVLSAHWSDGAKVRYGDPVQAGDKAPWAVAKLGKDKLKGVAKADGNCVWTFNGGTWITRGCGEKQKFVCKN